MDGIPHNRCVQSDSRRLTWSVSRSGDGNMSPASVSSSGTNTFIVSAPANAGAARTTYFTVTETAGGGRSAVVTATQKAGVSNVVNGLEITADGHLEMYWGKAAINYCINLGDGWRLPTQGELEMFMSNQSLLATDYLFVGSYWSSTIDGYHHPILVRYDNGKIYSDSASNADETYKYNVRCVRNVK